MTTPKILICIITGGRPELKDRPTRKLIPVFSSLADVEYVIREDHAPDYEPDPNIPLNVYSLDFANKYARTHWRHPRTQFQPDGFHGAFTGREWAMRSGEARGYDLVLQLDDNIQTANPVQATRLGRKPGWESRFLESVRVTAEISMSTNLAMLGHQLASIAPQREVSSVRVGYPYSFFFEKTGPGRMPYYGPFEDDIMHTLEYALNGGRNRTSGLIPMFTYAKESGSKTGMRKHYNAERGLEISRRYPNNVKLTESVKSTAPGTRERGVRHMLNTRGFTPIRVTDKERFLSAQKDLVTLVTESHELFKSYFRDKISSRSGVPE